MDADRRITSLASVPRDTTFLCTVRRTETEELREAVLVRTAERDVHGWLNYCRHLLDVRLDKGSGAPMRDGELVCANHGAYFEADSGFCTFGPCEGATLEAVDVTVEDGAVYLTDDNYEFVATGSLDDGGPASSSPVEF
ncbi:Rieske (2Fe-2S) protein [Haloplanus pelagicus]|jgi:nitrite reductase/ring-hydroxylating ferredoxin subunit|uniref:Rieske (2Fe-2S) protein n=1 Tax=Haloplanus pelagicus TaxID=2949995 RepID=UPI00203ACD40|nr:Rieske 2Fe-2S domain-containing protein [Haloplanus sp. HW8-1]